MNRVFLSIASVAILGTVFVPSPYSNSYDIPKKQLKHGIPIELILKNKHHISIVHNNKIATNGKSLDLKILKDTHTISNNRGKVYKQFYDKKLNKYLILGVKK